MGIGIVVRDYVGVFLAGLSASVAGSTHSIVAEFQALWITIEFCEELGIEDAHFEGDAQILIQAINNDENCWSWYGHLVESAKQIFKRRTRWSITFIHREGNHVAHTLAKHGLYSNLETLD